MACAAEMPLERARSDAARALQCGSSMQRILPSMAIVCAASFGCAEGAQSATGTSNGSTASGTGGGGAGPGSGGATIGSGGTSSVPGCGERADGVFVLGFDLVKPVLYRFDPLTNAFEELGPLAGCPAGTGFSGKNPWAAALDRNATMWTHYFEWDPNAEAFSYSRVHTIDTQTGACAEVGPGLIHANGNVVEYGLAYVLNPSNPNTDTLFASAVDAAFVNNELDTVDPATMAMTTVGPLPGTAHAFLTSTGDGRLYTIARATGQNAIRELDPATGGTISEHEINPLNSSQGPFVFWGGSMWAFWMKTYEPNLLETDVYKIDMSSWQAVKVTSVNFIVTAASVSTCAPLEIPR
jgi:hypothetical protein